MSKPQKIGLQAPAKIGGSEIEAFDFRLNPGLVGRAVHRLSQIFGRLHFILTIHRIPPKKHSHAL